MEKERWSGKISNYKTEDGATEHRAGDLQRAWLRLERRTALCIARCPSN